MIDEHLEELASLYVLRLLSQEEEAAFERTLASNPELQALVCSLQNASIALARMAPEHVPPPEVKQRLLASLNPPEQKIVPIHRTSKLAIFIPWAAAAVLAVFVGKYYQDASDASKTATVAQLKSSALESELGSAKGDLSKTKGDLVKTTTDLKETLLRYEADMKTLASLKGSQDRLRDVEKLLAQATAEIDTLKASNDLKNAQVAVMGSLLKDKPKAVAVSLWNQQQQDGLLVVENLPILAAGKDYQLWVIDPESAAPISAGVFKVDAEGKIRMSFKPTKAVKKAAKFAVTEEKEGGVESPTMNKMVVIGG